MEERRYNVAQEAGRHQHVAVADHKMGMARRRYHPIERKNFCARPGGRSREHNLAVYVRVALTELLGNLQRRVVRVASPDENFEIGIVLKEETLQIFGKPRLHAMHRLQYRDRG